MKRPFFQRKGKAEEAQQPTQDEIASAVANGIMRFFDKNVNQVCGIEDRSLSYGQALNVVAECFALCIAYVDSIIEDSLTDTQRASKLECLHRAFTREFVRYAEFGKVTPDRLPVYVKFWEDTYVYRMKQYSTLSGDWLRESNIIFGRSVREHLTNTDVSHNPLNSTMSGLLVIQAMSAYLKSFPEIVSG